MIENCFKNVENPPDGINFWPMEREIRVLLLKLALDWAHACFKLGQIRPKPNSFICYGPI